MSSDVADLRRDYKQARLDREDLHEDPVAQFRLWFQQAQATDLTEPNAMTLCTVDGEGQPNARTVLLKAYDKRGFVFFTNYGSAKGAEIAANDRVALLFPWLDLERQVKILGRAAKISAAESLRYFASRPFGSRVGAWVSQQSQVISSRSLLEQKFAELKAKFASGEVPLPSFWGGYRVSPHVFEFWQGRQSRLHDRFEYRRADADWTIQRLSP